jgi:benzoate-CoA ligase
LIASSASAHSLAGAPFNFAQYLIDCNATRGAKVAYRDDRGDLTYGELADRVQRVAAALSAMGVRREERVLLLMHDGNDWPVCFLGALYAGVVPVAVNTLLTADDYAYILRHSRAQVAWVSPALLPALASAIKQAPNELRHIIVAAAGAASHTVSPVASQAAEVAAAPNVTTHSLADLIAAQQPRALPAPTLGDDFGFWLYSSGSTGKPKAAVHTQANLYWTAELYGKAVLDLRADDVCFSAAKLFFAYGLGNSLTFPLSVGATVVLMAERPTPDAIFKRWREKRATVFFGAPTGYAALLASPYLPAKGEVALRMCSSAGEALPRDLGARFTAHFGCEIIDGIGSTEMLHIFLSNHPGDVRYGTTGKPVAGYEIALRREDGTSAPVGEIGDLYIAGPSAALFYWGDRAQSRTTFAGAWTRSGDKYTRDADGYYTYCGRSDDMLKVSGQFVSPFEVEATLVQHEAVLESALIGVADGDGITRSKAFVVLKPDRAPAATVEDELRAFLKARLAPHKVPREIEVIAELPKTATGKIQRFRLRERETAKK